jgi:hypothetical protein
MDRNAWIIRVAKTPGGKWRALKPVTQSLRDAVLYYREVKFRHHDDLRPGVLASSVEISF